MQILIKKFELFELNFYFKITYSYLSDIYRKYN